MISKQVMQNAKKHNQGSVVYRQYSTQKAECFYPKYGSQKNFVRNSRRQEKKRSERASANGILNNVFLPKMAKINATINERDFFKSLSKVVNYYGVEPIEIKDLEYPFNIHYAFHRLEENLNLSESDFTFKLQLKQNQDNGKTFIAVKETLNTGMYYYHIPIKPLYLLLQNERKLGNLFLSIYSFFYFAGIETYRDDESYLDNIYDILYDDICFRIEDDDWDEEKNSDVLKELNSSKIYGDIVLKKISNRKNLEFFEKRILSFNPKTEREQKCRDFAIQVYELYKKYPNANLAQYQDLSDDVDNDDDSLLRLYKCFGFVATSNDTLSDFVDEMINIDYGNYYAMEEPTLIREFEENPTHQRNREYIKKFTDYIGDLYALLIY
ncbi:hypothetical protein ACQ1Q5_00100 [Ornithobacterium rhinotracheale]